jgi:peptidyl-prolyl cis-trans isomerase SurA
MPLLPILAAALFLLLGAPAAAQDVQRIAAIVNDDVISGYDLEQRIDLVVSTTRLQDNAETRRRLRREVLRNLIGEKLQIQEAARNNIRVSDDEVQRALATVARQNNVPENRFDEFLRANGVPRASLEQQIKAEIAWGKLVRRRFAGSAVVSGEEIDEALERIRRTAGVDEFRVSELFLPVDSPEQEVETQRTAERLAQQIRDGAPFPAVARQFSRGSTAAAGGQIGWVRPGQLAPEIEQAVAGLQPGQVSAPVRSAGGFYVLQLHERRKGGLSEEEVVLELRRVLLPQGVDPDEVRRVAVERQGCESVEQAAQELGGREGPALDGVKLGQLPPPLRAVLAELQVGRFSEPVRGEEGAELLMVCGRDDSKAGGPSREQVAEGLTRQRMGMLAQRYMRDLWRTAHVELR